jgi:hypothetical protein
VSRNPRDDQEPPDRLRGLIRQARPETPLGTRWFFYIKTPDAAVLAVLAGQTGWRVAGLEVARDFVFNHSTRRTR